MVKKPLESEESDSDEAPEEIKKEVSKNEQEQRIEKEKQRTQEILKQKHDKKRKRSEFQLEQIKKKEAKISLEAIEEAEQDILTEKSKLAKKEPKNKKQKINDRAKNMISRDGFEIINVKDNEIVKIVSKQKDENFIDFSKEHFFNNSKIQRKTPQKKFTVQPAKHFVK